MGTVYKANEHLIAPYAEATVSIVDALITPGAEKVDIKVAEVTADEVKALLVKIDTIANSYQNDGIAVLYAENFPVVLTSMRMVKTETKSPFKGIMATGTELDAVALIPEHVGGGILNPAATAGKGLYGGASGAVLTWLQTFVAGVSDDLIPEQTMDEDAGLVHLGAIDTVDVPKINRLRFTISGVPTPAQPAPFNYKKQSNTTPFVRFEKPILVGPERTQKIDVDPNIAGDSKFELLSVLIARADELVL